jgi:hypothetical protein
MPKPLIKWGPGYLYQLAATENLDERLGWTDLRTGYQTAISPTGDEQIWSVGTDALFSGVFRFIPLADSLGGGSDGLGGFLPVNGWDGPYGMKEWLAYARGMNPFVIQLNEADVATDYTCYLVDPMAGAPEYDDDGITKRLRWTFRTVASEPVDFPN